ncbi:MAG TPA: exodeoxyribonuclease VII large subunit [Gemmatimonadaceae bacterium]|nr:exodeoxyribonuclease VII large subunit [Gemmatimonadaceae bacterium]
MSYGRYNDHGGGYSRRGQIEPLELPGKSSASAMSVTQLNDRIKTTLEREFGFLWIRGEVVDFKKHKSGHWYFCLRDHNAQVQCVVWARDQWRIPAPPDEGMEVTAQVQMNFFANKGTIQLRVGRIEAAGDGLWRKAIDATIAKLKGEGFLADERKRQIPPYPQCVAVVTSTSGAALRDIVAVAHRRRPGMKLVIAAAAVQGETAPREICRAIDLVMRWGCADVLIIARGGGSREDLHAFNHERVARAVAMSSIPTISAIGHEIDTTVCDLVADVRAATPSVAAERAIPSLSDMSDALGARHRRLVTAIRRRGESASLDLRTVAKDMRLASRRVIQLRKADLSGIAGKLDALSPLATLARGYSIARGSRGETLSSVADFSEGREFTLQLHDGKVSATAGDLLEKVEPAP